MSTSDFVESLRIHAEVAARHGLDATTAELLKEAAARLESLEKKLAVDDATVEIGARAMAIFEDYDGCFERIDEWNAQEQWQKEAYPQEEPFMDYEDADFWRKRTRAALEAVRDA